MKPLRDRRLYTFIDAGYLGDRDPIRVASELCDGGSDIIQLRAKTWDEDQVKSVAERVLKVLEHFSVPLVINDHPEIARDVGAQFCHLGQEDFFDAGHTHIQSVQDPSCPLCWGLSTHAPQQAQKAIDAKPDYIAVGPIYATGTKPDAKPVTLEYVRWASMHVDIPWYAIGGINEETIDDVLEAGATRICVVSAILNAEKISQACKAFKEKLK